MKLFPLVLAMIALVTVTLAFADGTNTLDDVFTVSEVRPDEATLTGKVKELKAGDFLYFVKTPFKFSIKSVTADSVVVSLPKGSSITTKNTMVRQPSNSIKAAIADENRLESALQE